jgi:pimeloyl-ACP methyl ester carboxylesterase
MPTYMRDGATIHFDLEGCEDGFPVLLIAPGGMRSCNDKWLEMPWNPRRALADTNRVIGMDQRNAGRSTAPVSGSDGWPTYAADQLGLLDHLGIARCHVVGMCIGGPYIMGLVTAAPERFASAVLLQPVGIDGNRDAFDAVFDDWMSEIAGAHPEATPQDWASFKSNMWDGEFVLTATRDQVADVTVPLLVAMGDDRYHPQSTSREIARLAPDVTFLERWKDDASLPATDATIRDFLARHAHRDAPLEASE